MDTNKLSSDIKKRRFLTSLLPVLRVVLGILILAIVIQRYTGDGFFNVLAGDENKHTIFLPLLSTNPNNQIRGQVTDEAGNPLAGVVLTMQDGQTILTGEDGVYQFSSLATGDYGLAPTLGDAMFQPSYVEQALEGELVQNFVAQSACSEAIVNGGFENSNGWQLPVTPYPARYTTAAAHTGSRALATGITNLADNVFSYSSGRQLIQIPADSTSAKLRLWLYPMSGDTSQRMISALPNGMTMEDNSLSGDVQYVLVLDPGADPDDPADDTVIETLLWMRSNSRQWAYYEFSLTKYAGDTIKIQVGAYNDGLGGVTAMYVDDVSVELCDSGTPPSPPSTSCDDWIANGGFEYSGSWGIPTTPYPAGYSSAVVYQGLQSMRTGITNSSANIYSYSDAWQKVSIPSEATSAELSMWMYYVSTGTAREPVPPVPELGEALSQVSLADDVQYVLILNKYDQIVETLMWKRSNSQTWTKLSFDLLKYRGQTIRIQFGTYNNGSGGVTAMYVDKIKLDICSGSTPSPTPTPVPVVCDEAVRNTGFEYTGYWGIPLTAFSADYSSFRSHLGAWSMRTGILYNVHNRYSYSDAYQTMPIDVRADNVTLGMWVFPISTETAAAFTQSVMSAPLNTSAISKDVQYVLLLDQYGNYMETLLWLRSDARIWKYYEWDLSRYAGMSLRLQFGTYNDGYGGVTAMYVDDVHMDVCR